MVALTEVLLSERPNDSVRRVWRMELLPRQRGICEATHQMVSERPRARLDEDGAPIWAYRIVTRREGRHSVERKVRLRRNIRTLLGWQVSTERHRTHDDIFPNLMDQRICRSGRPWEHRQPSGAAEQPKVGSSAAAQLPLRARRDRTDSQTGVAARRALLGPGVRSGSAVGGPPGVVGRAGIGAPACSGDGGRAGDNEVRLAEVDLSSTFCLETVTASPQPQASSHPNGPLQGMVPTKRSFTSLAG